MSEQTIPRYRTSTEIKADTLLALLRARFVDYSRAVGAMRLLGLDQNDMEQAKRRASLTSLAIASVPVPTEDEEIDETPVPPTKPKKKPTVVRPVKRVDDSLHLRCSQCLQWKPPESFSVRTDRPGSGTRRSACADCHRKTSRQRYLNVKAADDLSRVGLEFVVEGDDAARLVCVRCKQPILPGQEATVSGEVGHVTCPKEAQ